jgi:hypothetical protein
VFLHTLNVLDSPLGHPTDINPFVQKQQGPEMNSFDPETFVNLITLLPAPEDVFSETFPLTGFLPSDDDEGVLFNS